MKIAHYIKFFIFVCVFNFIFCKGAFSLSAEKFLWINSDEITSVINCVNVNLKKDEKIRFVFKDKTNYKVILNKNIERGSIKQFNIKDLKVLNKFTSDFGSLRIVAENGANSENDVICGVSHIYSEEKKNSTRRFSLNSQKLPTSYFIYNDKLYNENIQLKIYVYNIGKSSIDGFLRRYNSVGDFIKNIQVKPILPNERRVYKYNGRVDKSFHLNINTKGAEYVAYMEIINEDGTKFIQNPLSNFSCSSFVLSQGILSMVNTKGAPASVTYQIYSNSVLTHQGNLVFPPYAQKFINLRQQVNDKGTSVIRLINDDLNAVVANIVRNKKDNRLIENFYSKDLMSGSKTLCLYDASDNDSTLSVFNEGKAKSIYTIYANNKKTNVAINRNDVLQVPLAGIKNSNDKLLQILIEGNEDVSLRNDSNGESGNLLLSFVDANNSSSNSCDTIKSDIKLLEGDFESKLDDSMYLFDDDKKEDIAERINKVKDDVLTPIKTDTLVVTNTSEIMSTTMTVTPKITPTITPTDIIYLNDTLESTNTFTNTNTNTNTYTNTNTFTNTLVATNTKEKLETATVAPTFTHTAIASSTFTPKNTNTFTKVNTPTYTVKITPTNTQIGGVVNTPTQNPTQNPTDTKEVAPTNTPPIYIYETPVPTDGPGGGGDEPWGGPVCDGTTYLSPLGSTECCKTNENWSSTNYQKRYKLVYDPQSSSNVAQCCETFVNNAYAYHDINNNGLWTCCPNYTKSYQLNGQEICCGTENHESPEDTVYIDMSGKIMCCDKQDHKIKSVIGDDGRTYKTCCLGNSQAYMKYDNNQDEYIPDCCDYISESVTSSSHVPHSLLTAEGNGEQVCCERKANQPLTAYVDESHHAACCYGDRVVKDGQEACCKSGDETGLDVNGKFNPLCCAGNSVACNGACCKGECTDDGKKCCERVDDTTGKFACKNSCCNIGDDCYYNRSECCDGKFVDQKCCPTQKIYYNETIKTGPLCCEGDSTILTRTYTGGDGNEYSIQNCCKNNRIYEYLNVSYCCGDKKQIVNTQYIDKYGKQHSTQRCCLPEDIQVNGEKLCGICENDLVNSRPIKEVAGENTNTHNLWRPADKDYYYPIGEEEFHYSCQVRYSNLQEFTDSVACSTRNFNGDGKTITVLLCDREITYNNNKYTFDTCVKGLKNSEGNEYKSCIYNLHKEDDGKWHFIMKNEVASYDRSL